MINNICIIGVGLIGGSFAAGLKQSGQIKSIIGFGRNEENLIKAKSLNVIDDYSLDIAIALKGVDMVLIATPVNSFAAVLEMIKPYIDDSVVISDVGSTKGSVVAVAKEVFGEVPSRFIPAHPIAGKEKSGVEASDGELFNHKRVILTPEENADTKALEAVSKMWTILGAKVETMTHQKHDDLLAMTSHLPHMLAFGLMDYLVKSNPDACDYAAGGFKDFSRIASSDAVMWRDICLNNSADIVKHIQGYQQVLDNLSGLIESNESDALEKLFSEAKTARDEWIKD
ncbi:prephenate dehydrogenase/arogenate dehydrogenase family protein [Candidatus Thioglobus sp.]|jgi:prephenate dehydrogenase|uniref:prephenate dehydrogenase n=1 Tax=Candidatus Thioglobus sp. TaxID=2026721 RepID=UPI002633C5CA|nr:prephenate dehydrogenase/arogenate dehydrogenase family protein [Candidatus Thioglobus sp.]MDG2394829.1 prephenate dehydrogenase/arogenate dehydrogenase family protein [Candidatus Thioglobus sp.]